MCESNFFETLETRMFQHFAARAPYVVLETEEPEMYNSMLFNAWRRFLEGVNKKKKKGAADVVGEPRMVLWDMRGMRLYDGRTDGRYEKFLAQTKEDRQAYEKEAQAEATRIQKDARERPGDPQAQYELLLQGMIDSNSPVNLDALVNLILDSLRCGDNRTMFVLTHIKPLLQNPVTALTLERLFREINWANLSTVGGLTRVVLCGVTGSLPPHVSSFGLVEEGEYPTEDHIRSMLDGALEVSSDDIHPGLVSALMGLNHREVSIAVRNILIRRKNPTDAYQEAMRLKISAMKAKADFVTLIPPVTQAPPLVGMEALEVYARRLALALHTGKVAAGAAMMLIGDPGTGKSSGVELLSYLTGLPIIKVDFGAMMNSLVGASEERFRQVIRGSFAMNSAIVFIDEAGKQAPGQNTGGVVSGGLEGRMSSMVLQWINDAFEKKSNLIFVATENFSAVANLPPEFYNRFRPIWRVDPPDETMLAEIFRVHLARISDAVYDYPKLTLELTTAFTALSDKVTNAANPVGRDVVKIIRDAQLLALERIDDAVPEMQDVQTAIVTAVQGQQELLPGIMVKSLRQAPIDPSLEIAYEVSQPDLFNGTLDLN